MLWKQSILFEAGDGNRTHATSLEGWNSTIELHPQMYIILVLKTTIFIISQSSAFVKSFFKKAVLQVHEI